jgi:hypothetical protein
MYHGFHGDIIQFDTWPNSYYDQNNPYHIKASAIEEALQRKYSHILWLDCSVWALKDPNPIFDIINEQGYYLWKSGYNCAQVCSDACLNYFQVSREEAEKMPDCSSSMLGFNTENPIGKEFIRIWLQSAHDGVWNGSRLHDNQSSDPRFLFHRQDQSAASIIANKLGMKMHDPGLSHYYPPTEKTILTMRGI